MKYKSIRYNTLTYIWSSVFWIIATQLVFSCFIHATEIPLRLFSAGVLYIMSPFFCLCRKPYDDVSMDYIAAKYKHWLSMNLEYHLFYLLALFLSLCPFFNLEVAAIMGSVFKPITCLPAFISDILYYLLAYKYGLVEIINNTTLSLLICRLVSTLVLLVVSCYFECMTSFEFVKPCREGSENESNQIQE